MATMTMTIMMTATTVAFSFSSRPPSARAHIHATKGPIITSFFCPKSPSFDFQRFYDELYDRYVLCAVSGLATPHNALHRAAMQRTAAQNITMQRNAAEHVHTRRRKVVIYARP